MEGRVRNRSPRFVFPGETHGGVVTRFRRAAGRAHEWRALAQFSDPTFIVAAMSL
jgi:hypothetical protein